MSINLQKELESLNLRKDLVQKTVINLAKTNNININNARARVCLIIDRSGSMSNLYDNGSVQNLINRIVPVAETFDDDKNLDMKTFSDGFKDLVPINRNNFIDYVKENINQGYGGTNYANVLESLIKFYDLGSFVEESKFLGLKKKTTLKPNLDGDPVFVIFVTDGDDMNKEKTEEIIRKLSNLNIFISFVGIKSSSCYVSFVFLEKLDKLSNMTLDNVSFFDAGHIDLMSDQDLYNNLLKEYFGWLSKFKALYKI